MSKARELLPAAISVAAAVAVWEACTRLFSVSPFILPAPSGIYAAAVQMGPALLTHSWVTAYEVVAGFALGTALAIVLAFVIVHSNAAARVLYPLLLASQTIPKLAVAPLIVVWFGTGMLTKIIVVVLVCFFPTAVNVVQGMRSVEPNTIELVRLVSESRLVLFTRIQFPTSIPYFFAGLKISISAAVIGAIVGEWVGATRGVGYLILYGGQTMRTDVMFVGVVITVALGTLFYVLIAAAERALSWRA